DLLHGADGDRVFLAFDHKADQLGFVGKTVVFVIKRGVVGVLAGEAASRANGVVQFGECPLHQAGEVDQHHHVFAGIFDHAADQVTATGATQTLGRLELVGIMTLRNRLLPLVSLRQLFDLPQRDLSSADRIVVVNLNSVSVGLVMDRVSEVLRVPNQCVEEMPPIMARDGQGDITAICRLGDGKRLVSVIAPDRLLSESIIDSINETHESALEEAQTVAEIDNRDGSNADESQVVVFRLGAAEFGVPIESVQEIVRVPEALTRVPKSPEFVEGVINLRGTVLAVIDQRRRFGLDSIDRNDRQRIMVYLLNGTRTGFIVDSVAEVMKIPHAAIEDSPRLSADQSRLIRRVANLQASKRLVMMIEPDQLLEAEEIDALQDIAA
ncbi:MAG: hypothetical protein EBV35_05325, partial [Betaproteobacteria bacterium]|nr:hypothetical protein [Betaproteobacteria bacterium]